MKHRDWGTGSILLLGCVFSLGLVFYFLVSEGPGVKAAETTVAQPNAGQEWGDVFLPLLLNDWNYDEYGYGGGNGNGNGGRDPYELTPEALVMSSLDVDETERWKMDLVAGDKIMLTAAPGSTADLVLSIFDSKGNSLKEQNFSPGGEVETIEDFTVPDTAEYQLLVFTDTGQATDYALALLYSDEHSFLFRGVLFDNDSRDDKLPKAELDHFWFFSAQKGDTISFTVKPDRRSDPYVEFYGPTAEQIPPAIDDGADGEPESLKNYVVTDDGMYAISVGEFAFRAMDYTISFSVK